MKTPRILLAAVFGLAAAGAIRAADEAKPVSRAEVVFSHPEKFTDVKDAYMGSDKGRDAYLELLREHIVKQAARCVPEGQFLTVMVTDVDLAGDFEIGRNPEAQDVRRIKEIYPPRIDLYFKLTDASGKVLKEGTRKLRDMNFMMNLSINTTETLRYENKLIDDWMRSDFPRAKS
jgi:hypothetical protein